MVIVCVAIVGVMLLSRLGRTAKATERMANAITPRSLAYRTFNNLLGLCLIGLVIFVILNQG